MTKYLFMSLSLNKVFKDKDKKHRLKYAKVIVFLKKQTTVTYQQNGTAFD
jgi:hypothetical protein